MSKTCNNYISESFSAKYTSRTFNAPHYLHAAYYSGELSYKVESKVMVNIRITDTSFNPNTTSPQMTLLLADIESDNQLGMALDFNGSSYNGFNQTFTNFLETPAMHVIFYRQQNYVSYLLKERDMISPNAFAYFGFPQKTTQSYVTSTLTSGPLAPNDDPNIFGSIYIQPASFVIRTETQQMTRTIFNALGLLGGAWSVGIGLYAFLYGSDILNPWGCVHSYCCYYARKSRLQVRESFSAMLLQSPRSLVRPSPDLSAPNNLYHALEQRLDTLELFLKECVVDQTYLENLNDGKNSNKWNKLLEKWSWRKKNKINTTSNVDNSSSPSLLTLQVP
ncbi:4574_t:CDS:2 [Paraglomus brasilianum]|uniref:4574_t:CDS:1 n=1 Tax=Paraglomus brasilianum TaxID=144538 RepID=A0A9N9CV77_9GLOM|nr:4574_t:CDS:2 [Paraglomus brasilianum]